MFFRAVEEHMSRSASDETLWALYCIGLLLRGLHQQQHAQFPSLSCLLNWCLNQEIGALSCGTS
jgi:hypothetical protein